MNIFKNKYNMIVAADLNWCIGNEGKLLINIHEDMQTFKNITNSKVVIMGKKTQESLPNKLYLKNRINIVLSRNYNNKYNITSYTEDDNSPVIYLSNIDNVPTLINLFNKIQLDTERFPNFNYIKNDDVYIIGGGQIYKQFLENDLIDKIYLTTIYHEFNGDTHIPNLYDLGFKKSNIIIPKTTDHQGIAYEISILTK